jgi:hypothetical protein
MPSDRAAKKKKEKGATSKSKAKGGGGGDEADQQLNEAMLGLNVDDEDSNERSCTGVRTSHPQSRDVQIESMTLLSHGHELLADSRLELNFGRWARKLQYCNGCLHPRFCASQRSRVTMAATWSGSARASTVGDACDGRTRPAPQSPGPPATPCRRYGLLGLNGCGKSTMLKALAARDVPIPDHIDMFLLDREMPASEMSALEAVMTVDQEKTKLEKEAEVLSALDMTEEVEMRLTDVYERCAAAAAAASVRRPRPGRSRALQLQLGPAGDRWPGPGAARSRLRCARCWDPASHGAGAGAGRGGWRLVPIACRPPALLTSSLLPAPPFLPNSLDALDSDTVEVRAASILHGLGFTSEMQVGAEGGQGGGGKVVTCASWATKMWPNEVP